ncbi:molybdopterin converting factor subunit 1 [Thiorhodococcus mannitoliphagus]|uniref:Molybdopterin synthase sulfur carrier subunit n=1 Tax=Thiorhodococcus mannitoliphagus TaxID=329406 RepID=A0A6P1DYT4_9GAMM|nr:molybdopterin converting factor subunit 1 [Thiorhodococcus mannitoliphagus]NEX20715.1 molybdopterin converting factor subunit 1 [Thiorhodococcus mannitoliphagus]
MIRILYFARFREQLGLADETLPRRPGIETVADLLAQLRARGGVWAETLPEGERLMTAVNQELVRPDTAIRDGDELGIFPPVTGG